MSELDAERRGELAEALLGHFGTTVKRLPADRRGIARNERTCTCGEVLPWSAEALGAAHRAHVADALAPLIAGWLADDTAVCTTCQHRGGDDQPAQHPGCAAALGRIRAAALRDAAKEAEERGDIGKDGGPEAWVWLDWRADRAGEGA